MPMGDVDDGGDGCGTRRVAMRFLPEQAWRRGSMISKRSSFIR